MKTNLDIDTLDMLGAAIRKGQDEFLREPLPGGLSALIDQLGAQEDDEDFVTASPARN